MGKHTPGPFHSKLVSTVEMVGRNYAIRDSNLAVVAVFPSWKDNPEQEAESAANRRMFMAGPDMIAALVLAKQMVDEALPKFDWGKSCLDANAIRLLNDAPIAIAAALAKLDEPAG